RTMPEEINRIVTDAISDYLFVSEESGMKNLHHEGVPGMKTFMVGNVMIDSLILNTPKINSSKILAEFEIMPSTYLLATLHRPSNVDHQDSLSQLIGILNKYARHQKVIFPVHPRTKANLVKMNLLDSISQNLVLCDPIGYTDFLCLLKNARLVITDSGGIQEESTYLGVQCITLRENTERP